MRHIVRSIAGLLAASLLFAACGGDDGGGNQQAATDAKRGPIKVWYSNNPVEIEWAKQMLDAWNAAHPDEKVTAQEIPSGKSSQEVIAAAITAGNAPCLVLNGAQIATPDFEHMGGIVPLDDFPGAVEYIESRSGTDIAEQYKSPDGKYRQIPWKANPVMIFYNKRAFRRAGLDPEHPRLSTYAEFLDTARKLVADGGVKAAIWPSPTSEYFQSIFDFYPLFAAETKGTLLVEDGKAQFNSDAGMKVAQFWKTLYDEGLAPKEAGTGDVFGEGQSAMAIAGPWAIAAYKKIDWGVVPVPTSGGTPPEETWTHTDAKTISIYTACKNPGTAWEVLKFATSEEQDGKLLEMTGQMPLREDLPGTYPDYFAKNPEYKVFADQASRVIEVPYIPHSVEVWQTFRDAYSESVIFGRQEVEPAFADAAKKVEELAAGW